MAISPLETISSYSSNGSIPNIFFQTSFLDLVFYLLLELQEVLCVVPTGLMKLTLVVRLWSNDIFLRCWWLRDVVHVKHFTPYLISTNVYRRKALNRISDLLEGDGVSNRRYILVSFLVVYARGALF